MGFFLFEHTFLFLSHLFLFFPSNHVNHGGYYIYNLSLFTLLSLDCIQELIN